MRIIERDIHRVFAEAVAREDGDYRRLGRIGMMRDHLLAFAATLRPIDHVVVEATGKRDGGAGDCPETGAGRSRESTWSLPSASWPPSAGSIAMPRPVTFPLISD